MLSALRRLFTRKRVSRVVEYRPRKGIAARFDATQTGHENREHWAVVDSLGPLNANSQYVRNTLCQRARLERENNPHVFGMQRTLGHSFVGTGPRLQLSLDANLYESTRKFEQLIAGWMRATNFAEKLHLMIAACPIDGETFGQIIDNPALEHPIKIDVKLMEQEQIATPGFDWANIGLLNGLELDAVGNVVIYHVLKEHPGDGTVYTSTSDYDRVPATKMLHWFRPYRPGQLRGVSELASSIETCAQTRRYGKATLSKQELNANIAGVIESDNIVPDTSDAPPFATMEEIDIPRAGLMTMPAGMKAKPFETAQNATGFKEYMEMNYSAIGRPLGLPRNLITNDSSGFNFASGRMDHLPFQATIWIDRERCRIRVLDKVLKVLYAYAKEANLVPTNLPPMSEWQWDWQWDGFPSIDNTKDETAREMRLKNGISTLSEECAAEGKDWREVARQRANEIKYYKQLGLEDPYAVISNKPALPAAESVKPKASDSEPVGADIDDDGDDTKLERASYGRYVHV